MTRPESLADLAALLAIAAHDADKAIQLLADQTGESQSGLKLLVGEVTGSSMSALRHGALTLQRVEYLALDLLKAAKGDLP